MANWGEGLKGLGMYWSGQGAQYEQGRRADEEQRLLMDAARRDQLLRDAFTVKNQLESGDINSARYLLTQRLDKLREEGVDSSDTFTVLDMLNKGNIDGALREVSTVVDYANQFGGGSNASSIKGFAPQVDPETGQVYGTTFDPKTGGYSRVDVPGAMGLTPEQRAALAAREAGGKTEAQEVARRNSTILEEYAARNREAAQKAVIVREGLKYAQTASQGLTGKGKMVLSRIFPDIDVTDEAALDRATKQLALDSLAQFKGPTTDFEFGVVQQMSGDVGDSKSANIARLKAIERARWFQQRELQQLNKWISEDKDPIMWSFDFNEKVPGLKAPDGSPITLMDLQDTAVEYNLTIPEVIEQLRKMQGK